MEEKDFSMRLAQLRTQKGVSARDMSLSIGQNPGYINNIESGKMMPSFSGFFFICEYLGITPAEFFDFESADPSKLAELTANLKRLDAHTLDSIAAIVEKLARQK